MDTQLEGEGGTNSESNIEISTLINTGEGLGVEKKKLS